MDGIGVVITAILAAIAALMGNKLYKDHKMKKIEKDILDRRKNIKLAEEVTRKAERRADNAKQAYENSRNAHFAKYSNDGESGSEL